MSMISVRVVCVQACLCVFNLPEEDTFSEVMLLPCLLTSLTAAFPLTAGVVHLTEQKQTMTKNWKPVHLEGIVFLWLCIVRNKLPMQAINEMKPLKYHAFGG